MNLSSCSERRSSTYKQYVLTNTHTHTRSQNQLLPKSLLYVGCVYALLRVCVCMRVGSAVPPGCPEKNWQLEKLWLQGKGSRARAGDKEGRDRRERKATRHNNIHKGRAGSAKCGQQSLYLCDADSPLLTPTFRGGGGIKPKGEGENVFTLTRTFHRAPFCIPALPAHFFFFGTIP